MTRATVRLWSFVLCAAFGLASCAAHRPAPVIERSASPVSADQRADTYTVKRFDTLYSIALEHGADWREMASWNGISDPSKLSVGQVLRVKPPQAAVYASTDGSVQVNPIVVAPAIEARPLDGSSVSGAPAAPGATGALRTEPKGLKLPYSEQNVALVQRGGASATPVAAAPTAATPAAAPSAPAAGESPAAPIKTEPSASTQVASVGATNEAAGIQWSWPTNGTLSAKFAEGGSKGVQIGGKLGEPILASAAGKVTYVGDGVRGYGNLVIVKHNDQYLSVYAHNRKILVQSGQSVSKGQKIAEMGNGADNKPLLHFEIRKFGKPIDPLEFLPNRTD
jgi:lipoprotein NlpD